MEDRLEPFPEAKGFAGSEPFGSFPDALSGDLLSARMGERMFVLRKPFTFVPSDPDRPIVVVPPGYASDGASIPRAFWRILPPFGKYTHAAVVHDWLCDSRPCDYKEAAWYFMDAMKALGVNWFKRKLMNRAVLWFGPKFESG